MNGNLVILEKKLRVMGLNLWFLDIYVIGLLFMIDSVYNMVICFLWI